MQQNSAAMCYIGNLKSLFISARRFISSSLADPILVFQVPRRISECNSAASLA